MCRVTKKEAVSVCFQVFNVSAWALVVALVSTPTQGQELIKSDPPSAMGLLQAYEAATQSDAFIRAARAQADVVGERLVQAQAQLLPNVSFSASRYHNDLTRTQPNLLGHVTSTSDRYFSDSQTLQLRQPLYRPAVIDGVNVASYQVDDAQAVLAREVQNLGVRVAESYLQVLVAVDRLDSLATQQTLATKQLDSARKRLLAGQGIRTDIDEAAARLDLLQAQRLEAEQTLQGARWQLQMMVQEPVEFVQPLMPERMPVSTFGAPDVNAWMARAEASSPEVRALRARANAAAEEVKRAQAGHKPTLDGVVQLTKNKSENVTSPQSSYTNRQIGVQLNVPLYSGGGVQSAVRQALAEQLRVDETLESVRRDLSLRVQKEWRGVTEGVKRIQALSVAVVSTDQVAVSVRRSFEGGLRTVIDVLNAEQQAQQARRDLAEARYAYVASRLRLLSLAGELGADQFAEAASWFGIGARP